MLLHRTQCALLAVVAALLLAGCGVTRAPASTPTPTKTPRVEAAAPTSTPVPPTATAAPEPTAAATPTPSNLAPFTGLPVSDPAILTRHPIFVCINNDAAGRSQHYGLGAADFVYEYIVDGFALTRLTAMYQSQDPERVGPVRSARYPNIWLLHMYDGVLACSGGSDAIRYLLKNEVGFPYLDADIDDTRQDGTYFTSIGDDYRTRMQISPAGVRRWVNDQLARCLANPAGSYCVSPLSNWTSGDFVEDAWSRPGFVFGAEPPANPAGQATVITIPYPGGNNVEWRYDAALGGYTRMQGGQPQLDLATGKPIVASNVIVAAAQHELTNIIEDSAGTRSVDVKLYGFGDFRIFRDGNVYEGTWRADDRSPPRWLGAGDVQVALKPGQSWVQMVQQIPDISYQ